VLLVTHAPRLTHLHLDRTPRAAVADPTALPAVAAACPDLVALDISHTSGGGGGVGGGAAELTLQELEAAVFGGGGGGGVARRLRRLRALREAETGVPAVCAALLRSLAPPLPPALAARVWAGGGTALGPEYRMAGRWA
jgi:hypothetical protein